MNVLRALSDMFWTRSACTHECSGQFECLWNSPYKQLLNTEKKNLENTELNAFLHYLKPGQIRYFLLNSDFP